MNKFYFIIVTSLLFLNQFECYAQTGDPIPTDVKILRQRVRILAIGIGLYEESLGLKHLDSAHDLSNYDNEHDSIAYKYIWPSYNSHSNVVSMNGRVYVKEFQNKLYDFAGKTKEQDVVIIHILGHGEFDEKTGEYYLVCSDGEKIEGDFIRKQIYCMTDKGALVIIFLDTCHAGALFVGHEPKNNELKGAIAFFPSSKPEQSSFEIERKTLFSYNILETFKHKNGIAFDVGKPTQFISLGGIEKIIKYAFDGNNDQTPEPKFFSKDGKIDNYKIKYYPIIEQGKINTVNKQKNRFYGGIAVGSNHTCTPFADVNLGVDINNSYKIEVGFTHSLKKTDEVYMYDNNGIIQNALQYKAMSFYARYGFNWLSLCKDKRRSEFITLVGLSGNIVKGDNLSGFNSSIGKTAGSLMGDVCCRWALDLSKNNKRNVLLHMTAGFDFPIKRDGNVCNVLNSEKYIKNWCSFRPYIEAGVIISPKFLSF